jgi:uncharacterized protein
MEGSFRSRLKALVFALVDFGGRRPFVVIGVAVVLLAACWSYARKLEVRSDVMELLPRDSAGFQSFEHRLARIGGRATITIVAESPDRRANERFIDAAADALQAIVDERKRCTTACGPDRIAFIESSTKEVRAFFEDNKWLYADVKELEEADTTLDHQIAIQSGMVDDLADDAAKPDDTLGMEAYRKKWKGRASERDDFPTGYFASPDGTRIAMWVVSNGAGMGSSDDESLLGQVTGIIDGLKPSTFHPAMKVGLGGDIANAKAEKDSLISEALIATSIAAVLILIGVVWFYGSLWAIPLVFFPPLFGVGCAYAFATAKYGFVNSSGAFLGAIILGNGVNYPIVLYSRYKEFRARGMTPDVARREAVWNAFRAELVGASVASIAYGSLTVTQFRGFSQFGVIGFVGMLLVWISMIPCLPALIVLVERLQSWLPSFMRESPARVAEDGSRGIVSRVVGNATARWPRAFVGAAVLLTLVAVWRLPGFLSDPWEYDFDKLGSKEARTSGAFQWSEKANAILDGRRSVDGAVVLADRAEQVPMVKARILANDAADPKGKVIDEVTTIQDYLPGPVEEQTAKLAVLTRIRERITPNLLARMTDQEAANLREIRPPESLRVLVPRDLPSFLLRRFQERDGTVGTPFYIRFLPGVSRNDGHNLLRIAATIDGIVLPDGTRVDTASRSTVFAEMIRSLERDGPLATGVSFAAVMLVVLIATASRRGSVSVVLALLLGVTWTLGFAALLGMRLNFLNFIALPITFGIGSEYPFNIYDRSRLLGGDVTGAVKLHLGAVTLCSFTTVIGYGSLLFADNQALQSFGKLSIMGEIACVIAALFFLPAMLHLMARASAAVATTTASPSTASPRSNRVVNDHA